MFHMGWFLPYGFGTYGWGDMWAGNAGRDVAKPDLYVDMATSLERAGFDYMMIEDSLVIPDVYGGSPAYSLRTGVLRHDPMPLVPVIGAATSRIGIVATASTTFYPPFMAARLLRTLDHLTNGRAGVNIVTSSPHAAAQNFGQEKLAEHDLRYDMASDWMNAVDALWSTWDRDALVLDEESGVFADPDKVRYANYEGRWHRTRGPLNTVPSPQLRPVVCQAGASPAGRELAAKHADTVLAQVVGPEAMKEYRDDLSARMIAHGRKPSDAKMLFVIAPILGDTIQEAKEKQARARAKRKANVELGLSMLSYASGIDFAEFELDEPFPDLTGRSNGHQSIVAQFQKMGAGKTLREVAGGDPIMSLELVGTPDSVAEQMGEAMDYVGGDGYLISNAVTRKNIAEIADGLAPALRRRGLTRSSYTFETLRENLLEF